MTHTFSYKDFPQAYHKSSNYEDGVIKSLITWQDDMESGSSGAGARAGGGVAAAGASGGGGEVARCSPCRPATVVPTRL